MQDEDWADEEQKMIDLTLENQSLELDLSLREESVSFKAEDIDPLLENRFLKNVTAFEEADKEEPIPMRSLFPGTPRQYISEWSPIGRRIVIHCSPKNI